jgi:hypothetical protein
MTSVYAPLRADLRGILLTVPQLPAVAWEGRKFTPDPTVSYAAESLTPIASTPATLGTSGQARDDIVYTVKLHYAEGTASVSDIEDMADAIMAAFWTGRRVGSPTIFGKVTGTVRSEILAMPGRLSIAVKVRLFVYKPLVSA